MNLNKIRNFEIIYCFISMVEKIEYLVEEVLEDKTQHPLIKSNKIWIKNEKICLNLKQNIALKVQ